MRRPPIERWWPELSIQRKHEILEDVLAPLSEEALEEIERLTGFVTPRTGHLLDEEERDYIRTQREPVD